MELKDILVKERGWKEFLMDRNKKLIPVVIPSFVIGYVFYYVGQMFIGSQGISTMKAKLFVVALVFLFFWLVLMLYMVSCLVYSVADTYQKEGKDAVLARLQLKRY